MSREQLDAWLKNFRATTPRPRRQELIDRLDVQALLGTLETEPELRGQAYPLIVYVLAARALQVPADTTDNRDPRGLASLQDPATEGR